MAELLNNSRTMLNRVWADGAPSEMAGVLKAAGYDYCTNAMPFDLKRTWFRETTNVQEEIDWLGSEVLPRGAVDGGSGLGAGTIHRASEEAHPDEDRRGNWEQRATLDSECHAGATSSTSADVRQKVQQGGLRTNRARSADSSKRGEVHTGGAGHPSRL